MPHPRATLSIGPRARATLSIGHAARARLRFEDAPSPALRFSPVPLETASDFYCDDWHGLQTLGPIPVKQVDPFWAGGSIAAQPTSTLATLKAEVASRPPDVSVQLHIEGTRPAVLSSFGGEGTPYGGFDTLSLTTIGPVPLPEMQAGRSPDFYLAILPQVLPADAEDEDDA